MLFIFNSSCPQMTLFLHEDILARMLAFELELAKQRLDSIASGQGDPGRPPYERVFETIDDPTHPGPISLHRCHSLLLLSRDEVKKFYQSSQCPGIPSEDLFPIIRTLLSLPFSLLHTAPRLASMLPRTEYQNHVLTMGLAIIRLWFWDPPANIPPSNVPTDTNWPLLVMDPSRDGDTYERWKSISIPLLDFTSSSDPILAQSYREVPTASPEEDLTSDTTWSSFDYFVNEDASSSSSSLDEDAVPEPYPDHTAAISLWLEKIENFSLEVQEFSPSPYKRGAIGGMSMNDYLMACGAIHPKVWLDFLDLSGRVVEAT